jgi:hypothetical protein
VLAEAVKAYRMGWDSWAGVAGRSGAHSGPRAIRGFGGVMLFVIDAAPV